MTGAANRYELPGPDHIAYVFASLGKRQHGTICVDTTGGDSTGK